MEAGVVIYPVPPTRVPVRADRHLMDSILGSHVRVTEPDRSIRETIAVTEVMWRSPSGVNWPLGFDVEPPPGTDTRGAELVVGIINEPDYWAWKHNGTPFRIEYYPAGRVWVDVADPL